MTAYFLSNSLKLNDRKNIQVAACVAQILVHTARVQSSIQTPGFISTKSLVHEKSDTRDKEELYLKVFDTAP